jgi:hypothetical protein
MVPGTATDGRALALGLLAGLGWLAVVWLLLPESNGFGIVLRDLADPTPGELFAAVYVLCGPVLVVGLPVALLVRDGFVAPLAVTAVEVGSFLADPGGGDSVGTAGSLLWPAGLALIVALAAVEYAVRTWAVPLLRAASAGHR